MEEMSGPTGLENALFSCAQVSASYSAGDGLAKDVARKRGKQIVSSGVWSAICIIVFWNFK